MDEAIRTKLVRAATLFAPLQREFVNEWHWFNYHAVRCTPFMQSIACACLDLERISADAPTRMLRELAAIRGRERFDPHYDQLLQKLAEILVMRQVVLMPWPDGTSFEIEARSEGSDRRVDLVASSPDRMRFGFEVKAPEWRRHALSRNEARFQMPARGPKGTVERLRTLGGPVALPRDNTVRDFLRSANEKFAAFKAAGNFIGALVIVWDDYVYEPLTPLTHERQGLLTPNSYSRVGGSAETFPNVDVVIVLRHLAYFVDAAAERALGDQRADALHVGGDGALPNVFVPVPGGIALPQFVADGFSALPFNDPVLARMAEYLPAEIVFWNET